MKDNQAEANGGSSEASLPPWVRAIKEEIETGRYDLELGMDRVVDRLLDILRGASD